MVGRLCVLLTAEDGETRQIDLGGNTLCQAYLNALAAWSVATNNTGQNPVSPPSLFLLGTGSGTPAVSDTSLFSPDSNSRVSMSARTSAGATATFTTNYAKGQLNGTYTEAGMLDVNGNLMAHIVFASSLPVTTSQAATFIWENTYNAG